MVSIFSLAVIQEMIIQLLKPSQFFADETLIIYAFSYLCIFVKMSAESICEQYAVIPAFQTNIILVHANLKS